MALHVDVLNNLKTPKFESELDRQRASLSTLNAIQGTQANALSLKEKQKQIADDEAAHNLIVDHLGQGGEITDPELIRKLISVKPELAMSLQDHAQKQRAGRIADSTAARAADLENLNLQEGIAAPEVQVGKPGTHLPDAPEIPGEVTPIPSPNPNGFMQEQPVAPMPIRGIPDLGVPGTSRTPLTAQQKRRQMDAQAARTAAANAQAKFNEPYTLNPGDRRMVGGTVIASSPAKQEKLTLDEQTAAEWLKNNPGKTLNDYQDLDANRKRSITNITNGTYPGDFTKTGKDFLASIPIQYRRSVEKVANYDEDPTKVVSMRSGNREQFMAWVNQVNPAYLADEFANRAPTRKAFTTGTQGQQINSINTAIGHIDQITNLAAGLKNGAFVPGNQFYNWARTTFGSDAVTNFDTLKDALAGEVSSVLSKSGATVSGIAEAKSKINAANSPDQLAGYVKTLLPVMGSKLNALDYQYHQAMGPTDPFSALSPEAKSILQKNGFDPTKPFTGGATGTIRVQIPGQPPGFIDADQWDAFLVKHPGSVKLPPQ